MANVVARRKTATIGFTYTRGDLASAQVRAVQVAEALGARSFPYSLQDSLECDLVVHVKFPAPEEDMGRLRRAGVIQVLDPLDNYNFRSILKRKPFIDGVIAASLSHQIYLARLFDAPI
jgi:hypothetical protein